MDLLAKSLLLHRPLASQMIDGVAKSSEMFKQRAGKAFGLRHQVEAKIYFAAQSIPATLRGATMAPSPSL